jgi:hypothetical protein
MRQLSLSLFVAAVLAAAVPGLAVGQAPGNADQIPPPHPILTHIGHTPLIELSDGGAGLPYLGASAPYNAGDWENALKGFHDSGVYDREIAQIDNVADAWLLRAVRTGRAEAAHKHEFRGRKPAGKAPHGGRAQPRHAGAARLHGKKLALVLDIDETALSNYSAIVADNFTFGTNSQNEAVNKVGLAIAPTLELFNLAKRNGVAVFFIHRPPRGPAPADDREPPTRGLFRLDRLDPQAAGHHPDDRGL